MKFLSRLYSTVASRFTLSKFVPHSEEDYKLFRGLLIDNIKFSALQFKLPNLDKVDLDNKEEVAKYFAENEKHLVGAWKYVTNHHDKSKLGYCKVLNEKGEFVGNSGWILHNVESGVVNELERGIHLRQDMCSTNLDDKPSTVVKPRHAAAVMLQVVEKLEENKDSLNMEGKLISSILESNRRSQAFTQKYKLNVGEPTRRENGTVKWEQKIGDFVKRIPEIKHLLGEASKGR